MFLLFFAVWLILNGKVTAEICIFGAGISAALFILSIIRSVMGPGISDRIIAVNMTGTMVIMIIAVLMDENYLVDVCLIYAMISFLGVVALCKVYTGVYLQRKHNEDRDRLTIVLS